MLTSVLQPTHLILVLVIALLVLGPKRLPDAGRSLGQGIREFRRSMSGSTGEDEPSDFPGLAPLLAPDEQVDLGAVELARTDADAGQ